MLRTTARQHVAREDWEDSGRQGRRTRWEDREAHSGGGEDGTSTGDGDNKTGERHEILVRRTGTGKGDREKRTADVKTKTGRGLTDTE